MDKTNPNKKQDNQILLKNKKYEHEVSLPLYFLGLSIVGALIWFLFGIIEPNSVLYINIPSSVLHINIVFIGLTLGLFAERIVWKIFFNIDVRPNESNVILLFILPSFILYLVINKFYTSVSIESITLMAIVIFISYFSAIFISKLLALRKLNARGQ